jgi:hypothetical protein
VQSLRSQRLLLAEDGDRYIAQAKAHGEPWRE